MGPQGIEQVKSKIQTFAVGMEDRLMSSGHSFAMSYASRNLCDDNRACEELSGVSYLKFLQSLKEDDFETILQRVREIQLFLQQSAPIRFAVNSEEKFFPKLQQGIESFANSLPPLENSQQSARDVYKAESDRGKVFVPLQSGVNYCALSLPGVQYTHKDYPKLQVLSVLASYNYLHPMIREKGGAYGAGLRTGETMSFYSYRDPNVESTLDVYYNLPKWMQDSNNFSDSDIEEAKISIFGDLDSPVVPSRKGISLFHQGITNELKQQVRDGVFAVTRDDLVEMTQKYFNNLEQAPVAVIGNSEQIPKDWDVHSLEV